MTWQGTQRYRVLHHTAYRYAESVLLSHQQLHLTPRTLGHQLCQSHVVEIQPEPTLRRQFLDAFGNPTTEIAIETTHNMLDITSSSIVRVLSSERIDPNGTPAWEAVRDTLAYRADWKPEHAVLEATQFLFESPHVRIKRDLRAWASDCFEPGRPVAGAAIALMSKIHDEFDYDPEATDVTTPVLTLLAEKRGVCQDFAHLMISCLRSTGLAARYVSGYLVTPATPHRPSRAGADASHAWVSLFVPGHGWLDLDPTNNVLPSVEHITLGWGRDFSDVTPLRGIINGGGVQTLDVEVTVERF